MDEVLSGDPLADPKIDLNEYTILGLLGAFMKANPENRAYELAPFRAAQCVLKICRKNSIFCSSHGGSTIQKEYNCNMMENIGCLFVLCMSLATIPTIHENGTEALFDSANVVFAAMTESLSVMLEASTHSAKSTPLSLEIVHPQHLLSRIGHPNFTQIMRSSIKVARNILRDIARCIREGREPPNAKKTKARSMPPTDCWQPHTVYFMCSLASCHLAGLLKDLGNMAAIPGTMESVLIAASIKPKPIIKADIKSSQAGYKLQEEECRFEDCFDLAYKLGTCIVSYTFDERTMQEVRIARAHMVRKISSSDAEYSRTVCSDLRTTFLAVGGGNSKTRGSKGGSTLSQVFPANECLLAGNQLPSWSFVDPHASEALDLKDPTGGYRALTKVHISSPAMDYAEDRESKYFWHSLDKPLRLCYLIMRPLWSNMRAKECFRSDYLPPKIDTKDLSLYTTKINNMLLSDAANFVERLAYYSDAKHGSSSQNNPSRGIYWSAMSIIEWLSQETSAGRGFSQSPSAQASNLRKELRNHQEKQSPGFATLAPIRKVGIKNMERFLKSGATNLNLAEKLASAAKSAQIEAKIDNMHYQIHNAGHFKPDFTAKKKSLGMLDGTLQKGTKALRRITEEQHELMNAMDSCLSRTSSPESDNCDRSEYNGQDDNTFVLDDDENDEELGSIETHSDTDTETNASATTSRRTSYSSTVTRHESMGTPRADENSNKSLRCRDPLTALLESPLIGDIGRFRRGLKLAGIVARKNGKNIGEAMRKSISSVWSRVVDDNAADNMLANMNKQFRQDQASFEAHSKRIASDVHRFQKDREEDFANALRALSDVQDMEVSKTRAHKLSVLREQREAKKQDALMAVMLKKKKLEDEMLLAKRLNAAKKTLLRRQEEENVLEMARLQELKKFEEGRNKLNDQERRERESQERERLRTMADAKEWAEILRRVKEEARMKYLEELRRLSDEKKRQESKAGEVDLEKRRAAFIEERKIIQGRIRKGNFRYHKGNLGFYDDVRQSEVEWIQYEDASGIPYYYDPLLNKTTYETPTDARFHHYTVDERIAYDAIHGDGAYDLFNWNERNKESINSYGGYYDENGEWIGVNGVYGEDGVFYDLDLGYFNEWGVYTLHPVITETLDFMV